MEIIRGRSWKGGGEKKPTHVYQYIGWKRSKQIAPLPIYLNIHMNIYIVFVWSPPPYTYIYIYIERESFQVLSIDLFSEPLLRFLWWFGFCPQRGPLYVCVQTLKTNRIKVLFLLIFHERAGGRRPSCKRMPTKLCMMAWWWKPGLITLVYLRFR